MRGPDRALYFVLGLVGTLLVAWVLPVQAQDPPIEGQWTVVAKTVRPISGTTVEIGMEARNRMLSSSTLYGSERAVLTAGTVGKLATGVLRRANGAYGTYLAVKSLFDGAGWAINELKTQVESPAVPDQQRPAGTRMWCAGSPQRCTTTVEGAVRICEALSPGKTCSPGRDAGLADASFWMMNWENPFNPNVVALGVLVVDQWTPEWGSGTAAVPITDEQILERLRAYRPDLFAELLKDENGNVIITPEVADALNRFRAAVEAATGVTIPPVTSDPGTVDEGEGDATPSAWPAFCNWAAVVCELAEWMKREPELDTPDVPKEEADLHYVEWSSGLGGGVCPPPIGFNVTLGSYSQDVDFSFEGLCGFAEMMSPLVIAMGLVLGGFIIAGVRTSRA